MDAGAVFFAIRELHEGAQLNYPQLMEVLSRQGFPLPTGQPAGPMWVLWSSAVAANPGQVRFLQFAERELRWNVRRFSPADSYMVDPAGLGASGDPKLANRLMRFDASIAFAIGRIAVDHRIAVISDSFALAEPLVRAARTVRQKNVLAFFGRLLDPRWQRLLRDDANESVTFLDLDEDEESLFGSKRSTERNGWKDDFLLN
jgi:hypothetical protein